jgi:hypothetical protein
VVNVFSIWAPDGGNVLTYALVGFEHVAQHRATGGSDARVHAERDTTRTDWSSLEVSKRMSIILTFHDSAQ